MKLLACLALAVAALASAPVFAQTMIAADGWFRHQDGHVEYWSGGRLVIWARPHDANWAEVVASIPDEALETLGFVSSDIVRGPRCTPEDCDCIAHGQAQSGALPHWATHGVQRLPAFHTPATSIYRVNGRETSEEQALGKILGLSASKAAPGGSVPDDSSKQRVVVLGSTAGRSAVSKDWAQAPELAPFKDKVIFQSYDPGDWAVKDVGYTLTSPADDPTVYIVEADGTVRSQSGYAGPSALSKAIGRAQDPKYDPAKNPDLTKDPKKSDSGESDSIDPLGMGTGAGIGAGLLSGVALWQRRRSKKK